MRINQFVAAATGMSRRAADTAISEGRISVDGHLALLGEDVNSTAKICLDNQLITQVSEHTLVMLNKPAGYISSRARQGSAPTLYDLLPPEFLKLRITGRLDRDSSGLVLLTDDGSFIQRHTHPSFEKSKVYELTLSRKPNDSDLQRLESGVPLTDGPSHVHVIGLSGRSITVTLNEGRNRQLRRTFGALGLTVERLHRLQMGSYKLEDLPTGAWKTVSDQERL